MLLEVLSMVATQPSALTADEIRARLLVDGAFAGHINDALASAHYDGLVAVGFYSRGLVLTTAGRDVLARAGKAA